MDAEGLEGELASLRAELERRLAELHGLYEAADAVRNERNFLQSLLEHERGNFAAVEADRVARGRVIEEQGQAIAALHAAVDSRLRELRAAFESAEALRNEGNFARSLVEHLREGLRTAESDRAARGRVIEEQGAAMGALHAQIDGQLKELAALYETRERLRAETLLVGRVLDSVLGNPQAGGRPGALEAQRNYNHQIIDELARETPIGGKRILDLGASPHGFALEWALRHRVAEYIGIGLDMPHEMRIVAGAHAAALRRMNAEALDFPDGHFDAAVSISAFEHIGNLERALAECHRVLRPHGKFLVVFEPIWTSSAGHHLHHFGAPCLVPDWSHLTWTRAEMARHMDAAWPRDAPLAAAEALHWIYESDELNRIGIRELRRVLDGSSFRVERMTPMRDDARDETRLAAAAAATGLAREELMTRGFSIVLSRA